MTPGVGSIVANRFELVRELGRGAMGTVWLAEHLTLGVRCAVKFMNSEAMRDPEYAANYAARFEREARTIAQLGSTNVVRVLDYDTHEGVPFIAMECLQGEDLAARLARLGRLDAASTYSVVSQIANGLTKVHAAGIVHRDLKPDNIFLAQDDSGEVAKLLDFGVAKLTCLAECEVLMNATQAGSLIGTPYYMSPEQARGMEELDYRADLWSLAVITFECLTGRLPFYSNALGDLFAQIIFEPIPVPSVVDPVCTPEFDAWWTRAAARDPQERFASARDMADALGAALGVVEPAVGMQAASEASRSDEARPARARARRSRFLVVAAVVALAPLAVTLCSGAIDARSARGATSWQAAGLGSASSERSAPLPSPATHGEPVAVRVSSAPLSVTQLPAVPADGAAANRVSVDRAALLQPRATTPRRASSASRAAASAPDDIDFGI